MFIVPACHRYCRYAVSGLLPHGHSLNHLPQLTAAGSIIIFPLATDRLS
jgi:hypothetical protein